MSRLVLILFTMLVLAGCGGGHASSNAVSSVSQANLTPSSNPPARIEIAGTPPLSIQVGSPYSFQPTAQSSGGGLEFTIANKPGWAQFDTATGRLSGTPGAGSEGTFPGIVIKVADGSASAVLPAFAISVTPPNPIARGSATLTWTRPTQYTNGSPLNDLAGYTVRYGTSPAALTHTIQIADPAITVFAIENLAPATWHFAIQAYDAAYAGSAVSNVVSLVVSYAVDPRIGDARAVDLLSHGKLALE